MYTVAEMAELCKVNKETVYRWINEGRIDFIRLPGGRLRIPIGAVPQPERNEIEAAQVDGTDG